MKKTTIFLLCLLTVLCCITLAACNLKKPETDSSGGTAKTWPSATYLSDSEKYTAGGSITNTRTFDDNSVGVWVNGATASNVNTYVSQLTQAGWTQVEGSPADTAEKTTYGFQKAGDNFDISVTFFKSEQTSNTTTPYNYNLQISFGDDGSGYISNPNTNPGGTNTPAWYTSAMAELNNKSFSVFNQPWADEGIAGTIYESAYVEIISDAILVKFRAQNQSAWTNIEYYSYVNNEWKITTYNVSSSSWGEQDTAAWESVSDKWNAFENAVFIAYASKYNSAKAKSSDGSIVIDGKTCTKHDLTATADGETFGSVYYMWNDILVGSDYYLNAGHIRMNEVRSISAITAFSMSPASTEPSATGLATPVVSIDEDGTASWAAVTNASGYKYKINNGTEQTAPSNRSVSLTDGQSIVVKAVGDGTTYTDSGWSASQTYTAVVVTSTWPTSTTLAAYGFGGLSQPTGSTLSTVADGTSEGQPFITMAISNGTDAMFGSLSSNLYNAGASYGYAAAGGMEQKATVDALKVTTSDLKVFHGFKPTATANLYYFATVEYFVTATTDEQSNPIAANTLVIFLSKLEVTPGAAHECNGNHTDVDDDGYCDDCGEYVGSGENDPSYGDYINLPAKFTITYNTNTTGETKTLTKDGDKLYWRVVSEYEDRDRLAIKQADDTYKIYERDNKSGGTWDTSYVPEYNNVFFALEALDDNFVIYAQKEINEIAPSGTGSGTVAGMTCNIYHYVDGPYTYSYSVYSGLVFKAVEQNSSAITNFEVTAYSTTADLSGANYQL